MVSIYSLPQDVLARIISNCHSITAAARFAATCKHVSSIWVANAPDILSCLGHKTVLYFETALIVVRATNIVKTAFEADELPPPISPFDQQLGHPSLSVAEFKQIFGLQKLAKLVEEWILRQADSIMAVRPRPYCPLDKERPHAAWNPPVITLSFRDRVWRSMLRLLLAGAVCSRVHNKPLWASRNGLTPPRTRSRATSKSCRARSLALPDLKQFPSFSACSMSFSGLLASPFTEVFAQWFAQDVARCFDQEQKNVAFRPHPDISQEEFAEAEVGSMIIVFNEVRRMILSADDCDCDSYLPSMTREPEAAKRRKVSVVLFGVFRPEEMSLPSMIPDTHHPWLIARSPCLSSSGEPDAGHATPSPEDVARGPALCDQSRPLRGICPNATSRGGTRYLLLYAAPYDSLDRALLKMAGAPASFDTHKLYRKHSNLVNADDYRPPRVASRWSSSRNRPNGHRQMRYPTGVPPALMYGVSWDDSSAS